MDIDVNVANNNGKVGSKKHKFPLENATLLGLSLYVRDIVVIDVNVANNNGKVGSKSTMGIRKFHLRSRI